MNIVSLQTVHQVIESMKNFVDQAYIPPGVVLDRDLSKVEPVDFNDPKQVQEFVTHSWYDYEEGKAKGLHPYDGETKLNYTGPKPPYEQLDTNQSYSWLKSPVEVGPLARVAVLLAKDHEPTKELVNKTLTHLDLPTEALFSTLGRTAARALESRLFIDQMDHWYNQLISNIKNGDLTVHNPEKWKPSTWSSRCRGVGFMEVPRGALGHWVDIRGRKIRNYVAVVPSTWNAGPRDAQQGIGPYEAALMDNHTLYDAKQPLEIQRTVHSFDPCIACAVHVHDPDGKELTKIKVR